MRRPARGHCSHCWVTTVGEALSSSRPTASDSSLYGHGTIREIGHVVLVLYEYSTPVFYKNTERCVVVQTLALRTHMHLYSHVVS